MRALQSRDQRYTVSFYSRVWLGIVQMSEADVLGTQVLPEIAETDDHLVQTDNLVGRLVVQHLHLGKEERELFAEYDGGWIECAVPSAQTVSST